MATNVFLSKGAEITLAGGDVYPGPGGSKQAVVHSIYVSNIDGANSATVDIKARNTTSDAYRYVAFEVPVPAGSTLVLDKPIDLSSSGTIHMKASATGDLETVMGILEIDP